MTGFWNKFAVEEAREWVRRASKELARAEVALERAEREATERWDQARKEAAEAARASK